MFDWLMNDLSTIVVGAAVLILLAGVIYKMRKDKRQGKKSCGCNCSGCPSAGICHTDKN